MTFTSRDLTISTTTPSVHREADRILREAGRVSADLGIIAEGLHHHHTTMTNYLYVDAPVDKMVNAVVTYDVLYYFDDFFGEDTNGGLLPDFKDILAVWSGAAPATSAPHPGLHRLYNAIAHISASIRNDSPTHFFEKYTRSITEHLSYSLREVPYSTVEEYVTIRLYTGGMLPVIDLIEYTHSLYLDDEALRKVPALEQLRNECALIGALSNDIFSYAKEKHSAYNLINAYLRSGEAKGFQEAVRLSIRQVNDLHAAFGQTVARARREMKRLHGSELELVHRYVKALEVIIASCYHWQKQTGRYRHPENVFADMRA